MIPALAFAAGTFAGFTLAAVLHSAADGDRWAETVERIADLEADRDRWKRVAEGGDDITTAVRRVIDGHGAA